MHESVQSTKKHELTTKDAEKGGNKKCRLVGKIDCTRCLRLALASAALLSMLKRTAVTLFMTIRQDRILDVSRANKELGTRARKKKEMTQLRKKGKMRERRRCLQRPAHPQTRHPHDLSGVPSITTQVWEMTKRCDRVRPAHAQKGPRTERWCVARPACHRFTHRCSASRSNLYGRMTSPSPRDARSRRQISLHAMCGNGWLRG